jgi:hypothetical protein
VHALVSLPWEGWARKGLMQYLHRRVSLALLPVLTGEANASLRAILEDKVRKGGREGGKGRREGGREGGKGRREGGREGGEGGEGGKGRREGGRLGR